MMERRKEWFDFLLTGIRPGHIVGAIICIAALIFLGFLPYWIMRDTGNFTNDEESWKILYYYSTYIYTLIALFTLLVIGCTAFAAFYQLSEIKRSRQLEIIFEISKMYSTPEMYHALRTVFDDPSPPKEFVQDDQKDFQRRVVVNFWETVALAALEDQAVSELVRLRLTFPLCCFDQISC